MNANRGMQNLLFLEDKKIIYMKNQLIISTLREIMLLLVCGTVIAGCESMEIRNGEAEILQSWQGDYPVAQLKLIPEKQREHSVGFIDDSETFTEVWKAFKPGEAVPKIDFRVNLVLFARNTQFYNSIGIGKVNVTNGVAEVLAIETMSAMPIEDKVAMSIVVVAREGISGIQVGDEVISIKNK